MELLFDDCTFLFPIFFYQCNEDTIEWHNVGTLSGTGVNWVCYFSDANSKAHKIREVAVLGSTTQIDPPDKGASVTVRLSPCVMLRHSCWKHTPLQIALCSVRPVCFLEPCTVHLSHFIGRGSSINISDTSVHAHCSPSVYQTCFCCSVSQLVHATSFFSIHRHPCANNAITQS